MLGNTESSSTPKDFQPNPAKGLLLRPQTAAHARSAPPGNGYIAVGMTRALDSSIGLPSRPTSASWMVVFAMPDEVRRSFTPSPLCRAVTSGSPPACRSWIPGRRAWSCGSPPRRAGPSSTPSSLLKVSLLLKLFEVGIHPIQPLVQRPLVLGQPIAKRLQVRRFQPIQPATPLRSAPDESHFAEDPEVLRDLRLRHRQVVHDRPDRLLSVDQRVQDLAAVCVRDGIENVRCRGSAGHHPQHIFRYRHVSSRGRPPAP